ncbi:hypothetical protein KAR91_42275 [Candidatus Pacearchaeota archaeon]|nr:hypothetical protein [Candidatus Pacearchaeota archaeon]
MAQRLKEIAIQYMTLVYYTKNYEHVFKKRKWNSLRKVTEEDLEVLKKDSTILAVWMNKANEAIVVRSVGAIKVLDLKEYDI